MLQPTVYTANAVLHSKGKDRAQFIAAKLVPEAKDFEVAKAALEWARAQFGGLDIETCSDFENNMRVATKAESVVTRTQAFVAYAVAGYLKHMQQLAERAASDGKVSEYIGAEGDKVRFTATVVDIRPMDSAFGTTYLTKMVSDGNQVAWFASSPLSNADGKNAVIGDVVTLDGTVKALKEFRGVKQTTVTRCKLVTQEVLDKEAAKAAKEAAKAAKALAKAQKQEKVVASV